MTTNDYLKDLEKKLNSLDTRTKKTLLKKLNLILKMKN